MRLIDADALIESIKNTADLGGWIGAAVYHIKQVAIKYIGDAPSIDIEQKRGEWERVSADKYVRHAYHYYRCSECGYDHIGKTNFCPNCGAKMVNGEGGE